MKKYEQHTQRCAEIDIQFESFRGFSHLVGKFLKRSGLLDDYRNFRSAGLSVDCNQLSQGIWVTLMRSFTKILIARSHLLWDPFMRQHSHPHKGQFIVSVHPNFSCPVIAVWELVCHPIRSDNAHLFLFKQNLWVVEDEILNARLRGTFRTNKRQTLNCVGTKVICG